MMHQLMGLLTFLVSYLRTTFNNSLTEPRSGMTHSTYHHKVAEYLLANPDLLKAIRQAAELIDLPHTTELIKRATVLGPKTEGLIRENTYRRLRMILAAYGPLHLAQTALLIHGLPDYYKLVSVNCPAAPAVEPPKPRRTRKKAETVQAV